MHVTIVTVIIIEILMVVCSGIFGWFYRGLVQGEPKSGGGMVFFGSVAFVVLVLCAFVGKEWLYAATDPGLVQENIKVFGAIGTMLLFAFGGLIGAGLRSKQRIPTG